MQRAITIHSFEHACAALEAAVELSAPVLLVSAPDAGLQSGPAWFASVIGQAVESVPGAPALQLVTLLDCSDKPGCVLAALRHGVKRICFTGPETTRRKLLNIAESYEATVLAERPEALELLGQANPDDACRVWLTAGRD